MPDGGCIIDGEQPVKRLCRNGDTLTLHITESRVQSTNLALAAIRGDATVAVYGHRLYGGDCRAVQDQLLNVQHLQATDRAFAAIRGDGNVVTWGDPDYGGDSSAVRDQLKSVQRPRTRRSHWRTRRLSFDRAWPHGFVAMWDSSIVSWGDRGSSNEKLEARKKVKQIQASEHAVAAILEDGSVQVWPADAIEDKADQLQNVQHIQAAVARGFAAILADGTVVAWHLQSY